MWHTTQQAPGNGFSTSFQFRRDGVGRIPADRITAPIEPASLGR